MAFQRPTLSEIIDRVKSDILSRIDGANTILRRSLLMVFSKVFSGQHHLQYGYLEDSKRQLFLLTADSEYLEIQANEYGIARKDSTYASGSVSVTGTAGTVVPSGQELTYNDLSYTVDTAISLTGGVDTLDITSSDKGLEYNRDTGDILTFTNPLPGVDTTVTVLTPGITGGLDIEDPEDLRSRTLIRKRQSPHAGALFDYETWMLEVAGVTRAWAIEAYFGEGTIGCAFAQDDLSSIIPNETQRQTVLDYITSHTDPFTGNDVAKPVGARPIMIETELYSVNLTVQLKPNTLAVQTSVNTKVNDVIYAIGGPGVTINLSVISAAISSAVGEEAHRITFPTDDIAIATNKIPVLGTITFEDYT